MAAIIALVASRRGNASIEYQSTGNFVQKANLFDR